MCLNLLGYIHPEIPFVSEQEWEAENEQHSLTADSALLKVCAHIITTSEMKAVKTYK